MEYERMREKPQGGLSPRKLRSLLMGVEKRRSGVDEEVGSASHGYQVEIGGCGEADACRDVVEVEQECGISASEENVCEIEGLENGKGNFAMECDNVNDGMDVHNVTGLFEFQKGERVLAQRGGVVPFSKHAPSKWDDAQKWIASPTSNRPKVGQVKDGMGGVLRKVSFGKVNRQLSTKVVLLDSMDATEEPDTKRMDSSHSKETDEQKFVEWENHSYQAKDEHCKPLQMIESGYSQSAKVNLSCRDSSMSISGSTTFIPPPSTARSVSMRDMGTEMTPIASQEPSRTGTPVRSTTPPRSATLRPTSPGRKFPAAAPPITRSTDHQESNSGLSEKEIQMKTRREIMALGTQLGKTNIAAWASKVEEDNDASTSLKIKAEEKSAKSVIDARAAAWEEAEKTNYMARFKRDGIRILAWENHQKAKAEAEMKKAEMEVERLKAMAHERLANKLAETRHKAEEKRAAAEAKLNRQAATTEHQVEYIRRTGRTPSSFSCCCWCS